MDRPLPAVFFRTETGREPVREWLQGLQKHERKIIGIDVMTVQYRWPLGMPLVRNLGSGLWEIRSALPNRIARTLFFLCMKEKLFFCTDSSRKPEKLQRKTGHWLYSEKCVPQDQLRLKTNIEAVASGNSSGRTECSRKFRPWRSSERWH